MNKYLMLDTETANTLDDPLVYDLGIAVIDENGKVYEKKSFIIYDIYFLEKELMQSAYYAEKLPKYEKKIEDGKMQIITIRTAKKILSELYKKHNIGAIVAHNMSFDNNSLNTTLRYVTKSKMRYFFPYGAKFLCTLNMARNTILKNEDYRAFCNEDPENRKVSGNRYRATAEILYQFFTGKHDFIEEHMGIEDVLIEKEIFKNVFDKKNIRYWGSNKKKLSKDEKRERGYCKVLWGL